MKRKWYYRKTTIVASSIESRVNNLPVLSSEVSGFDLRPVIRSSVFPRTLQFVSNRVIISTPNCLYVRSRTFLKKCGRNHFSVRSSIIHAL